MAEYHPCLIANLTGIATKFVPLPDIAHKSHTVKVYVDGDKTDKSPWVCVLFTQSTFYRHRNFNYTLSGLASWICVHMKYSQPEQHQFMFFDADDTRLLNPLPIPNELLEKLGKKHIDHELLDLYAPK